MKTVVTDLAYSKYREFMMRNSEAHGMVGVLMNLETKRHIAKEMNNDTMVGTYMGEIFSCRIYETYSLPVNEFRFFIDK